MYIYIATLLLFGIVRLLAQVTNSPLLCIHQKLLIIANDSYNFTTFQCTLKFNLAMILCSAYCFMCNQNINDTSWNSCSILNKLIITARMSITALNQSSNVMTVLGLWPWPWGFIIIMDFYGKHGYMADGQGMQYGKLLNFNQGSGIWSNCTGLLLVSDPSNV